MKKVAFSTLSTTVENSGLNSSKNSLLNKKNKTKKGDSDEEKTFRFEIIISDSSDDFYQEFSYKELLKDAKVKDNLSDDPEALLERAEEEKMQQIAKNLEAKYAPKKNKFRGAMEDYIDKGLGYDETDSFIDNEEAYDELIPSSITTKYGGFYVNFGKLEFRACSDEEDNVLLEDDDSKEIKPVSKKRKSKGLDFNKNIKKKKVFESDESNENQNSCELESEECDESNDSDDSSKQARKNKSVDTNQTIDSIIESVVKKVNKNVNQNKNISITEQSENDQLKLNDGVPERVKEILIILKDMKLNQPDKKQRFFNDKVNKHVLEIDLLIQNCPSIIKNQVYTNLSVYLACAKDTLVKRIRKLRITHEENKLKQSISVLRMEVSYVIEEYEEAYEAKLNKWKEDKNNGLNVPKEPEILEKEFKFNDKIKNLLKQILNSKRMLIDFAGIKGKQEEDNITNFFNNEIKNIWPANWISNSTLLKTAGFISKYQEPSKSTVSVIKKSPQRANNSSFSLPLNLNVSKNSLNQSNTSLNLSNNNINNINNNLNNSSSKPKQVITIDLSENSVKQDKIEAKNISSVNNSIQIKQESLLNKKQSEVLKSNTVQPLPLTKQQNQNISDVNNIYAQVNSNLLNKDHQKPKNKQKQVLEQKLIGDDKLNYNLEMARRKELSMFKQEQLRNSMEKFQNLTNYASSPQNLQNMKKKPVQDSPNILNKAIRQQKVYMGLNHPVASNSNPKLFNANELAQKKLLEQQFSQMRNFYNTNNLKSSTNKSLEVDYKFDTAIKKSLIKDSGNPQNSIPINTLQRSNSLQNANPALKIQSKINSKSSPKTNINNSSTPQNKNLNFMNNQQQFLEQIHHYMNHINDTILKSKDKKSQPSDLTTNPNINNYNFGKNYNTGNNQVKTNANQPFVAVSDLTKTNYNFKPSANNLIPVSNNSSNSLAPTSCITMSSKNSSLPASVNLNTSTSNLISSKNNLLSTVSSIPSNSSVTTSNNLSSSKNLAQSTCSSLPPNNSLTISSNSSINTNINLVNSCKQPNTSFNSKNNHNRNDYTFSSMVNNEKLNQNLNSSNNNTPTTKFQTSLANSEMKNFISNCLPAGRNNFNLASHSTNINNVFNNDFNYIYSDQINTQHQLQQNQNQQLYQRNLQRQEDPKRK